MDYKMKTGELKKQKTACLVLGVFDKRRLSPSAAAIDKASNGFLSATLKKGDLDGDVGQTLLLYEVPGTKSDRVLLVNCGKPKAYTREDLKKALTAAIAALVQSHATEALVTLPELIPKGLDLHRRVCDTVATAADTAYRFDQTKSKPEPPKRPLKRLDIWVADPKTVETAQQALSQGEAIARGVALAKDLGNLPGNICTPSYLGDQAHALAKEFPALEVEILEEAAMEKLGMGALLSVSRGSRQPAKLIIMKYQGADQDSKPVVLVGKGLTFDAGGISIKPAANMDEMKYDMCGGASVFGALRACLQMQLPLNLIGIVPASENLPDGDANKPGDIVTSMSGQTIEILNTDAEGRLILCDALTYSERFDPAVVIDMATLTGACVIALGKHPSGLFTAKDDLANEILAAGEQSGDRAWRMPLWEDYQEQLDSNFADMANIGGREGGAITAACFLARYTRKLNWAHLDIAGTAWLTGKEKGATGRPVPLLTQFLVKRSGLPG